MSDSLSFGLLVRWIGVMIEGLELFMFVPWLQLRLLPCGNMIPYDWIIACINR
jgi:hypothetical protein